MTLPLQNRGRFFPLVLLRAVVAVVVWLPLPAGIVAVWWYGGVVQAHEAPDSIAVPTGEIPSRVRSARGFHVGGLQRGTRGWTPYHEMSPALIRALVAAEDARFFRHGGFDLEGIARALRANVEADGITQGGSTITQQLAKGFVGPARTMERKLIELVVARRIERRFDKSDIFEAWANRIYFGSGATGVGAAADLYFGCTPADLELHQAALLAALVPAPAVHDPVSRPDAALRRRDRVLDRLEATGLATAAEAARARAQPLGLASAAASRVSAPDVERGAWRRLSSVDADVDWRYGRFDIWTTIDLVRQRHAEAAVRQHIRALEQRQGWRGPLARVTDTAAFDAAWDRGDFAGEIVPARVLDVQPDGLTVWAGGRAEVRREGWEWAVPWRADATGHGETLDDATAAFAVGDVVALRGDEVVPIPHVEAAFAHVELATGELEARVGTVDATRSAFDRVVQGCRQPGSTFKPFVYSAALDGRATVATTLRDGPMRIELGPMEEWRPRNADGSFEGHVTLWGAFVWSRNLPTLELYRRAGPAAVVRRARALGITTELDAVDSMALGASCVRPVELLGAYATLARGGRPALIRDVSAVRGDAPVAGPRPGALDRGSGPLERIAALLRGGVDSAAPVMDERTAFLTGWLLREAVRAGTGQAAAGLPWEVAGKTGTTNAYDAWFAGFSGRDASTLWIGADRNERPLGRRESGMHLALPAWIAAQLPPLAPPGVLPAPPAGVVFESIDPESGLLAGVGRASVDMPFVRGSQPTRQAPSAIQYEALHFDRFEREER